MRRMCLTKEKAASQALLMGACASIVFKDLGVYHLRGGWKGCGFIRACRWWGFSRFTRVTYRTRVLLADFLDFCREDPLLRLAPISSPATLRLVIRRGNPPPVNSRSARFESWPAVVLVITHGSRHQSLSLNFPSIPFACMQSCPSYPPG